MSGTGLFAPLDSVPAILVALTDESNNAILVKCATGSIPSGNAGYAIGCELIDTTTGLLYTNTGTAASCTFTAVNTLTTGQVTSAKLAANTVQYVEVALTAAQINALFTTSIEIIPAVTGKAIILDSFVFDLTGTATQFTAGGVVNLQYANTANGGGTTLHADIAATVLTGATARIETIRIPKDLSSIATTAINGIGVFIGAKTQNFATGTGTAICKVSYHVV